ncbi:MAG TPA: 1-(5-phosphoribosyl)-5-[(5-phosphoribosylamino)methylideneamino]imidazole-4-carboxamide isomerase [Dehalococcoidia bacterium]|nr:1-(5-phosphoribosyl)-5-[(5-phosphoribosylamino)methylideneamino]imidazole-4-carboxamide isomerase [Dehalococcoidia bacterium]
MEIIPAVDIKGGKCVRLYQGDYSQETVFSEDPVAVALNWQAQGAHRLHVVDLDGAASGEVGNIAIIEAMAKQVDLPIQLGGGIRREEVVEKLLRIGIERVVLGTVAVEQAELVKRLCRRFSGAIVVGIDARDGYVATHGWRKGSEVTAVELARRMVDVGVRRLIYTDIERDGTLTEPNFEAIAGLVDSVDLPVIASGGISLVSHLEKLKELRVEGAIVGKALYTGDLDLKEALTVK